MLRKYEKAGKKSNVLRQQQIVQPWTVGRGFSEYPERLWRLGRGHCRRCGFKLERSSNSNGS